MPIDALPHREGTIVLGRDRVVRFRAGLLRSSEGETMSDPYLLDRPAVISTSGGRTSGYMLYQIIQAFGGTLPADVVPIFCNTGKERPETLDFVERMSQRWGVRIVWLEYRRNAPHKFVEVNYATASRDGRPFDEIIKQKMFLPNVVQRFCTQWLKIKASNRYARHVLGWTPKKGGYTNAVGLRYDEPHRVGKLKPDASSSPGEEPIAPLYRAKVTRKDVIDFWAAQPFDLELKGYQGNCDLCFLKGQAKLMQIMQENPELASWWIEKEKELHGQTRTNDTSQFRKNVRYASLLKMVQEQRLLPFCEDDPDDLAIYCRCTD
jgi:3'-phosphoadenosine 5'-phosphosulfate sulfotransferase (PAPS reductase)/FAD synthetase